MQWCCAVVLWHLVACRGAVQWCSAVVQWCSAVVLCSGAVQWCCVLIVSVGCRERGLPEALWMATRRHDPRTRPRRSLLRLRSRASVVLSGKAALLCRRRYWSASESVSSTDRRTGTPQYNHFQRCAHPACDLRTKTPLARLRPRTAMAATAAGSSTSTCRRHTRRS